MRSASLILILIFACGCQQATSPLEPELGEEFKLEFGEQAIIPEKGITIQFTDVLVDSRCPIGVACVWAGNAEIAIQFNDQSINLNSYISPKQYIVSGFTIELRSLQPYPVIDDDVDKEEYTAGFIITKN